VIVLTGAGDRASVSGAAISKFEKARSSVKSNELHERITRGQPAADRLRLEHFHLHRRAFFGRGSAGNGSAEPGGSGRSAGGIHPPVCGTIGDHAPLTTRALKRSLGELGRDEKADRAACEALVKTCFSSQDYIGSWRAFMQQRAACVARGLNCGVRAGLADWRFEPRIQLKRIVTDQTCFSTAFGENQNEDHSGRNI
jgi:hypothetical protein